MTRTYQLLLKLMAELHQLLVGGQALGSLHLLSLQRSLQLVVMNAEGCADKRNQ